MVYRENDQWYKYYRQLSHPFIFLHSWCVFVYTFFIVCVFFYEFRSWFLFPAHHFSFRFDFFLFVLFICPIRFLLFEYFIDFISVLINIRYQEARDYKFLQHFWFFGFEFEWSKFRLKIDDLVRNTKSYVEDCCGWQQLTIQNISKIMLSQILFTKDFIKFQTKYKATVISSMELLLLNTNINIKIYGDIWIV